MNNPQPVLGVVITNSGGEGKTTCTETLAALATLSGRKVQVVDIDPGNRGFTNRNGDESAVSIDWAGRTFDVNNPHAWYDDHMRGKDLTLLDTGANMLVSGSLANQFIMGLLNVAAENDVRTVFYCVTSPNKPGSDELVEIMYQRFHRAGEIVIVQNDRDGSGEFKPSLAQLGTPIVNLPYLRTGLLALRLQRQITFAEFVQQPVIGYERATATIAAHLLEVARQSKVQDVVGDKACEVLKELSAGAIRSWFYTISSLRHTTNDCLTANERLSHAWQVMKNLEDPSDADLLVASRDLLAKSAAWEKVR